MPLVDIVPLDDEDDETIRLNPLFLEPLNADHDGDTLALYVIHDQKALEEAAEKAYLGCDVHYDHSDSFLSLVRHEALYSAYILTKDYNNIDESSILEIDDLSVLPESIQYYNHPSICVEFRGIKYSYGICLFNKWCGFDKIIINELISKKNNNNLSAKIYKENPDKIQFYQKLNHLEKNLFLYISINNHFPPTINIKEMISLSSQIQDLAIKIPSNIELGYLINQGLIKKCLENFGKTESTLYNLFKSGSRFSEKQLSRSCINIGFVADGENKIVPLAFNTNLLKGLTEHEFFESASGTRKGISDKSRATPASGYLERSLAMGLSVIEIAEEDCHSPTFLTTKIISKRHIKTLIGKWFKRDVFKDWEIVTKNNDLEVGDIIYLRSPIFCTTPNLKICRKCWGEKVLKTKYLGILAGQILSERFTQLSLRSFHDSGSASLDIEPVLIDLIKNHLTDIKNEDEDETIILEFDIDKIPDEICAISGFKKILKNCVYFQNIIYSKQNNDPVEGLKKLKNIMRTKMNPDQTPEDYYQTLMKIVLDVGSPYSSFVECLLTNMFVIKNGNLWRYNQVESITKKLGDRTLSSQISPLLNLLYQQNEKTIENIEFIDKYLENDDNLTIYEKMFLERF
jgi:hypothetical protein